MYRHFKATASPPLVRSRRVGGGLFLAGSNLLSPESKTMMCGLHGRGSSIQVKREAVEKAAYPRVGLFLGDGVAHQPWAGDTCRSRSSSLARVHSGRAANYTMPQAICVEKKGSIQLISRLGGLQVCLLTTGRFRRFIGPKHGQQNVRPCLSYLNLHTVNGLVVRRDLHSYTTL